MWTQTSPEFSWRPSQTWCGPTSADEPVSSVLLVLFPVRWLVRSWCFIGLKSRRSAAERRSCSFSSAARMLKICCRSSTAVCSSCFLRRRSLSSWVRNAHIFTLLHGNVFSLFGTKYLKLTETSRRDEGRAPCGVSLVNERILPDDRSPEWRKSSEGGRAWFSVTVTKCWSVSEVLNWFFVSRQVFLRLSCTGSTVWAASTSPQSSSRWTFYFHRKRLWLRYRRPTTTSPPSWAAWRLRRRSMNRQQIPKRRRRGPVPETQSLRRLLKGQSPRTKRRRRTKSFL